MAETCKGCGAIQKEEWPKGKAAYRCMNRDAGERCGRVVEVAKRDVDASLICPEWCPRKEPR